MGIGSPATERSRERQLRGSFNSETKCSMGWSDCGKVRWSSFTVRSGKHQLQGGLWRRASRKLRFERASQAPYTLVPRSPSKPLRAASPPRAQASAGPHRAPLVPTPLITPHAKASPTNHEIRQRRKRSTGKFWTTELLGGCPPLYTLTHGVMHRPRRTSSSSAFTSDFSFRS